MPRARAACLALPCLRARRRLGAPGAAAPGRVAQPPASGTRSEPCPAPPTPPPTLAQVKSEWAELYASPLGKNLRFIGSALFLVGGFFAWCRPHPPTP